MSSKFINSFEKKVVDFVKKEKLIKKGDKIAVAASGGKDSATVLYILNKYFPDVEAITIDAYIGNYTKENLVNLKCILF